MRRFIAAALVSAIALGAAVPAEAGQFSIRLTPHGHHARVLRQGLQLYSLFKNFKNQARVDQRGNGNSAGIGQFGSGDAAAIIQNGSGNSGKIVQRGNNDAFALFQFGNNNSSTTQQTRDGEVGILLQGGW